MAGVIRVIIHGCFGAMGLELDALLKEHPKVKIVAGVDKKTGDKAGYPVYSGIADVKEEADAVIDFSTADAVCGLLFDCREKNLPLVLCTTGLTKEQLLSVEETAKVIPLLRSANMSLGVNLLLKLAAEAAHVLARSGFDIEIVEKHHRRKLDAPSGTAIALAESVNSALDNPYSYVFDRSRREEKRPPEEIGILSVRGGTIVGEHDVIFAGEDEVVTISHHAASRRIFAKGAIDAALFLVGKAPGLYSMKDVIAQEI